jgi:uncharacterized repeat protein (TIGR03843 family)
VTHPHDDREDAAGGWPVRPAVDDATAARLLRAGEADLLGRLPWSSNATFLVCLRGDDGELLAVYKPQRGERPLWDFPRGTLCRREVAAHVVSEALGWQLVPDTVLRDGPAGTGMMQRFVPHDPEHHYFTLLEEHADTFRRLAAFDVLINNTDRKGGHCLRDERGRIWAIDHGVAFHAQPKLRTVIWDFAGEPVPHDVCADLHRLHAALCADLEAELAELLDRYEVDALRARLEALLATGTLPAPDPGYHSFPWPLV